MQPPSVSVVVPVYNEAGSVRSVVETVKAILERESLHAEIVVVDDGSIDETSRVLEGLPCRVIRHEMNRGYGASLKTGILAAAGEIVVITDADGTYPLHEIPALVRGMAEADMVVGARRGESASFSAIRRFVKGAFNKLGEYLTESRIPDMNSGFRAFRKESALRFIRFLPPGFSFTSTLTLAMHSTNLRVKYHPIEYDRRHGKSKFRPVKDTYNFFVLIVVTVSRFNPLKVFLPAGLGLVLLGGFVGVFSLLFLGKLLDLTTIILVVTGVQMFFMGVIAELIVRKSD